MTLDEFGEWSVYHRELFQLNSEADDAMIAAWMPLVLPYSKADFMEASLHVSGNVATAFRTTHLTLIRQRISSRRLDRVRLEHEAVAGRFEEACADCRGVGMAIVPHLDFVRDGEWAPPFPTFAICCYCARGRSAFDRLYARSQDPKHATARPLDFARYEGIVPHWRELVRARAEAQKQELAARAVADYADRKNPLAGVFKGIRQMKKATVDTKRLEDMRKVVR